MCLCPSLWSCKSSRLAEVDISMWVFHFVMLNRSQMLVSLSRTLAMGAWYAKAHTENQKTDLGPSQEAKQARLSGSLSGRNRWKQPLIALWGQWHHKEIIELWSMQIFACDALCQNSNISHLFLCRLSLSYFFLLASAPLQQMNVSQGTATRSCKFHDVVLVVKIARTRRAVFPRGPPWRKSSSG